jgi:hypothetical protein
MEMPKRNRITGGQFRGSLCGTIMEGAVVVTLAEKGEGAPLGVTEFDTVQVASDGAPVQLNATAALKPLMGVTCRL